jgi:hypothetical protein
LPKGENDNLKNSKVSLAKISGYCLEAKHELDFSPVKSFEALEDKNAIALEQRKPQIHTNETLFEGEQCSKSFTQLDELKTH